MSTVEPPKHIARRIHDGIWALDTLVLVVRRPDVTVMFTVLAALAPTTALVATLLLADSTLLVFTARTAKYHEAGASELSVALRRVMSSTMTLCVSDDALVPYTTLNRARLVNVDPSELVVGAVQFTVAVPEPQLQVSV